MKINAIYLLYAAYVEYGIIKAYSSGQLELGAFGRFVIPLFFFFFVSFFFICLYINNL